VAARRGPRLCGVEYVGVCFAPQNAQNGLRLSRLSGALTCNFARLYTREPRSFGRMGFRGSRVQIPPSRLLTKWPCDFRRRGCYFRRRGATFAPVRRTFHTAVVRSRARHGVSPPIGLRRTSFLRSFDWRGPRLPRRKLRRLQISRQQLPLFVDDGTHGLAIGLGITVEKTPQALPPADRGDIAHRPVLSLPGPFSPVRMPDTSNQFR
jgi:hypothetical protein